MENKEYKAIVEKDIRFPLLVILLLGIYVAASLASDIQMLFLPNIDVEFCGILIAFMEVILLVEFLNRFGSFTEEVTTIFKENEVVFICNGKERVIQYSKIKNVVKVMEHPQHGGGSFKILIRVRGKNYRIFSGETPRNDLLFEQTEISKIYYEFKNRGILCC